MRRNLLFLLIFCAVTCLFSSCKKTHTDKAAKHRHHLHHSSVSINFDEDDVFNFKKVDTTYYYYGEIEDSTYYFKIDHVDADGLRGHYYSHTTSEFTSPTPFKILYKKKKYLFQSGNRTIPLKFDITIDTAAIFCVFYSSITSLDKKDIAFERYHEPEYHEYQSDRYKIESFEIKKEEDIVYGEAKGFWTSNEVNDNKYLKIILKGIGKTFSEKNLDLTLDLYRPVNDSIKKRPLLVLIHGGAFYIGDKGCETMTTWCEHFAKSGYVVASINYRMGFRLSKASIQKCGYEAIQDAHAAVRFLAANADKYDIDPNNIFIAGTSAGSITALGMTFMTNPTRPEFVFANKFDKKLGNIESSGNDHHCAFKIKAIANMWGAVYDLDELNGHHIPVISFHGTTDNLVPFDEGFPFSNVKGNVGEILFDKMYGAQCIHHRLDSLHIRNEFYPIEGAGHSPYEDKKGHPNECYYFIQDKMEKFFFAELIRPNKIIHKKKGTQIYTLNPSDATSLSWKVEGGFILSTDNNSASILWRKDARNHKITVSGIRQNGTAFTSEYNYK